MKKYNIHILMFSLLILFLIFISVFISRDYIKTSLNKQNSVKLTVIIDAGHGGEDGGAVAPDGSLEKDFNLDIALKLEKILNMYGFDVIMTRREDKMTCSDGLTTQRQKKVSDIRNRLKLIENNPNSIFVSIHQNNFSDCNQYGTQVFYSGNNLKSKTLADCIQQSVVKNLQLNNKRIIKKSGTEIFLLYKSKVPSVLVECGFLSNIKELELLKTDTYRQKLAIMIADGIIKYNLSW